MAEKEYNPEKLYEEMIAAGLEIIGVTSDGRIDWAINPSEEMITQAEQIKNDHMAVNEEEALRKAYREKGLDNDTVLFALWAKVMENNSTSADQIQSMMNEIKAEMITSS